MCAFKLFLCVCLEFSCLLLFFFCAFTYVFLTCTDFHHVLGWVLGVVCGGTVLWLHAFTQTGDAELASVWEWISRFQEAKVDPVQTGVLKLLFPNLDNDQIPGLGKANEDGDAESKTANNEEEQQSIIGTALDPATLAAWGLEPSTKTVIDRFGLRWNGCWIDELIR